MPSILIYAKLFELAGKGGDGIEGLTVALLFLEGKVNVEHVLPLLTDDGQRLYLCQVELVEGEDRQDGTEAALLVRKREDQAGLVNVPAASDGCRLLWTGKYEETCEVVLVRLNTLLQHLHAVDLGSILMADGSMSVPLLPADVSSSACSVRHFDHLEVLRSLCSPTMVMPLSRSSS